MWKSSFHGKTFNAFSLSDTRISLSSVPIIAMAPADNNKESDERQLRSKIFTFYDYL